MYKRPDYETALANTAFSWHAGTSYSAYIALANVPIHEFFQAPAACIEAYRTGRARARELFGPDVAMAGPATPPVSYGHPNGLGAKLYFPDGGEVAVEHLCADSLDHGIDVLRRPVDYARAGMAPFYIEFREKLRAAFPGEAVGLSYGAEGPLTSAYELRGDAFFLDPFDEPEKTKEFLRLLTSSILDFHAFRCRLDGREPMNPNSAGMCDDIASMLPPRLWDEFVLPYWEQYYSGMTTGTRSAHVENLKPDQLPFLEDIGLCFYDPSISPDLDPKVIAARCRVPFLWRLGSFHYRTMSCQDVRDFVFQAVSDGASQVCTYVAEDTCDTATVAKVHAFIQAGKEVRQALENGGTRADIAAWVSPEGRKRFWTFWPDQRLARRA
jgi:hypothetical protein